MKVVPKEEKKVETVEKVELCAIERNWVVNRIQKIYELNKDAFDEYAVLVRVLETQVNMIEDSDKAEGDSN